ncbi:hypothetical protein ACO0QE_003619 [Hanseniaspora vineae]
MGKFYSPLSQTFGSRPDDFSYSAGSDFRKSHLKLNHKLVKLRQYCHVLNKNTKSYDSSKLGQFSAETYAKENKLQGALVLHLIERDLVYVESLRLNHRVGKKNQRVNTRLKKASKYAAQLKQLVKLEKVWQTKLEYLVYSQLATIEYYSATSKKSGVSESEISLRYFKVLMGLDLLLQDRRAKHTDEDYKFYEGIVEKIKDKYRYIPLPSTVHNKKDVAKLLSQSKKNSDKACQIFQILNLNNYNPNYYFLGVTSEAMKDKKYIKTVEWRSFKADVNDEDLAKHLTNALNLQKKKHIKTKQNVNNNVDASSQNDNELYDEMLMNYSLAEEHHQKIMDPEDNTDQILSTFISYNKLFVMIQRDALIFENLLKSWNTAATSGKIRYQDIGEIYAKLEKIANNLSATLTQVTALPGVYSDDDLLGNLHLSAAFYKSSLYAYCLAPLYKIKGQYVESMALLNHSLKALNECHPFNSSLALPGNIVNGRKVASLKKNIELACLDVESLAIYQQKLRTKASQNCKYNNGMTLLESGFKLSPSVIELNSLFPLKPTIKPVMAKPTLFDLAYNYIEFNSPQATTAPKEIESKTELTEPMKAELPAQKKGFLGFFRS